MDHAHHGNNAIRALHDTLALSDAVQRAMDLTNEDDTLLVLSSDHSHVFTISGYSLINTDILCTSSSSSLFLECAVQLVVCLTVYDPQEQVAEDDKPYATLSYNNGPGYELHRLNATTGEEMPRRNLEELYPAMSE